MGGKALATKGLALLYLAAGLSRRFGEEDKLAQPLNGVPLASIASARLATLPFARRLAVVSQTSQPLLPKGFETIINPHPENGLGHSIALGAQALYRQPPDISGVMIMLADMPLVSIGHFEKLATCFVELGCKQPVVSRDSANAGPPAILPSRMLSILTALTGDHGAKSILEGAVEIIAAPGELADVDTAEQFQALL